MRLVTQTGRKLKRKVRRIVNRSRVKRTVRGTIVQGMTVKAREVAMNQKLPRISLYRSKTRRSTKKTTLLPGCVN